MQKDTENLQFRYNARNQWKFLNENNFLDGVLSVPYDTRVTIVANVTVESGGILKFGSDFVVLFPVHVTAGNCFEFKDMQSFPCADVSKTKPNVASGKSKRMVRFEQNAFQREFLLSVRKSVPRDSQKFI